jgi:hypothetical protein
MINHIIKVEPPPSSLSLNRGPKDQRCNWSKFILGVSLSRLELLILLRLQNFAKPYSIKVKMLLLSYILLDHILY